MPSAEEIRESGSESCIKLQVFVKLRKILNEIVALHFYQATRKSKSEFQSYTNVGLIFRGCPLHK